MKTLQSFTGYAWLILLPIALISFVPLALNADSAGGIPVWAYWQLGLVLTLALAAWGVVTVVRYLINSRHHHNTPKAI